MLGKLWETAQTGPIWAKLLILLGILIVLLYITGKPEEPTKKEQK